ncbi:MAG: DUF370 domain-containing protein [Lachnospiraceae bacterium]|nr:DUF370 domain-containing protein [Lachnospiraceae bacterium]
MQRLINAGYGNSVNSDKVISVASIDAAPIKRLVQNAKDMGKAIDMTQGRKTKSVIIMEDGYVGLSALVVETFVSRFNDSSYKGKDEEDE